MALDAAVPGTRGGTTTTEVPAVPVIPVVREQGNDP